MSIIIQCTRDEILKPLQTVVGVIERKESHQILSNVLIETDGTTATFTGTDVEVFIRNRTQLSVSSQPVSITTSARKLTEILRSLPNQPLTITLDAARLTVQCGKSRFAVQTLPADDFPVMDRADAPVAVLQLPQRALRHMLHMVVFATAQNDVRYYLNGVLLQLGTDGLHAVATDTHRLAWSALPDAAVEGPAEVILPRKTVQELLRQLGDSDEPVRLEVHGQMLRVQHGAIDMVSKLIEGRFPDYRRVIPTQNGREVTLRREDFASALSRVAVLTHDKFRGVRIALEPGLMRLNCRNVEQEEASEELEVDYSGEPLEIAFNVSYLQEVLSNVKTEQVRLAFGDANSSALLTLPEDANFQYVIMPMRL